ncbi:MAG: DUF2807 domain-containing protein [Rubrivivax sp.]|nr:DUF2807 domain-containing protein [Rubrivivax sp.]
MRRTLLLQALAAAAFAASLAAPPAAWARERVVGSGRAATEARTVGDFDAVGLLGSIDVVVRQGAKTSVSVTADDNLLPLLETVVEPSGSGARLVVRWKSDANLTTRSKPVVQVVTPRLTVLAVAGSGDARVEAFSTPSLRVALSGSGDAALTGLKTESCEIALSGSGDVRADGEATRLRIRIAGSGDVAARDLRADEVSVSIAGSGDAVVQAQKKLDVAIAGSGDVTYRGDAEVSSTVAGSGSVRRR